MASSNTQSYHINGPCAPQVNVGAANAYVTLGVCYDGVDIQIQNAVHGIKSDGGGGPDGFEVDDIWLNAVIIVRFTLVPFAGNYVNILRQMSMANGGTGGGAEGTMQAPGTLFGENLNYPSLYIPLGTFAAGITVEGDPDGPWWFKKCRVVNPGSNKVGVKETMPVFEFRCINYFAVASFTSVLGNSLYARTAAS